MQIVAKPKRGQETLSDNAPAILPEITPGSMVACFVPQYRDEIPQIGKLLETNDKEVRIEWWIGTYTGTWRALRERVDPLSLGLRLFPSPAFFTKLVLQNIQRYLRQTKKNFAKHTYHCLLKITSQMTNYVLLCNNYIDFLAVHAYMQ